MALVSCGSALLRFASITFGPAGGSAEVPEPEVEDPRDVVVAVELSAICGSDLHPYRGAEQGLDVGTVFGHEFLGRVLEVGADVATLAVGDRVVAPFTTSCAPASVCAI